MVRKKNPDLIQFVVTYEDGSTAPLWISRWHLRTGDHIARKIAEEKQREEKLPQGKIVGIRRQFS